jgi:hypothetical protein
MTPNGAKDATLVEGGVQTTPVVLVNKFFDLTLQQDGKVIAVGLDAAIPGALSYPLDENNPKIARSLPSAGLFDAGFGPVRGGYAPLLTARGAVIPRKVVVDGDGALVVGGYIGSSRDGAVVKLR